MRQSKNVRIYLIKLGHKIFSIPVTQLTKILQIKYENLVKYPKSFNLNIKIFKLRKTPTNHHSRIILNHPINRKRKKKKKNTQNFETKNRKHTMLPDVSGGLRRLLGPFLHLLPAPPQQFQNRIHRTFQKKKNKKNSNPIQINHYKNHQTYPSLWKQARERPARKGCYCPKARRRRRSGRRGWAWRRGRTRRRRRWPCRRGLGGAPGLAQGTPLPTGLTLPAAVSLDPSIVDFD